MIKRGVLLLTAAFFAAATVGDPIFMTQGKVPDFGLYVHGVLYWDCPEDYFC